MLAIDIGNTNIHFMIFSGKTVYRRYSLSSQGTEYKIRYDVNKLFTQIKREKKLIGSVCVCSVVPYVLKIIQEFSLEIFELNPIIIGMHLKIPIKNNYKHSSQVGQDRLLCSYAAREIFGQPLIVIDFGTAVTFDVVNSDGEYDGGMILPGIHVAAKALNSSTALLPEVDFKKKPKSLIGRTTEESILSGLFYGYSLMCNGLISELVKINKKAKIIVTGGDAALVIKYLSIKDIKFEKELLFKGIGLLQGKGLIPAN